MDKELVRQRLGGGVGGETEGSGLGGRRRYGMWKGRNKKMADGSPDLAGEEGSFPPRPARWTVFVRRCPPRPFFIFFYFRLIGFISPSFVLSSPPAISCQPGLLFGEGTEWGVHTRARSRTESHRRKSLHHGFSSSDPFHVTILPSPQTWSGSSIFR